MKKHFYSGCLKGIVLPAICMMALSMTANAQWSSPQVLYEGTASPQPEPFWIAPVIVSEKDPSGAIHLVWTNKTTDVNVLAHAVYANGVWSNMEILPSMVNTSAMLPSFMITPNGRMHVAYTALMLDETWSILYTSKPAGGQWSTPAVVSTNDYQLNAYPQIFYDSEQMPHVIYMAFSNDGMSRYLKHVKFNPNNLTQIETLPVPTNSTNAFNPRVVRAADGNIHCFWYNSTLEGTSVEYASYNGTSWSATTTLASSGNTYVLDESAVIPVATTSGELYAIWYDMALEAGIYKHYIPTQGWSMLQTVNDGAFVMGDGISDSENKVHVAGNLNDYFNETYDLKYHFLSGGQWTHETIEQSTDELLPAFPSLEISGDILFCFYARITSDGDGELVTRWKTLDYLTPAVDIPLNKDIALKVSPNPLNPSSIITFTAQRKGEVQFILTDALGRAEQATMQIQEEGINSFNFQSVFKSRRDKGVYILTIATPWGKDMVKVIR